MMIPMHALAELDVIARLADDLDAIATYSHPGDIEAAKASLILRIRLALPTRVT